MKNILLLITLLFMACEPQPEAVEASAENTAKDDVKAIDVRVEALTKSDIQDFTSLTAKLEAIREIDIAARVSGQVRSFVENGKKLSKGSTVFDIDGALYYGSYKAADAQAKFAEKNAEKLSADYKKYEALFASKDISKDELMRHEVAMLQAMQMHQAAETAKRQALLNYQNASYKAPFNGVVGQMNLSVGQQVMAGQAIGKFADMSAFKAVFSLSVDEARRFNVGDKAEFTAKGVKLEGHVKSISPLADSQTGSYLTKVEFKAGAQRVFSGQFGTVKIFGETLKNVFTTHQDNIVLNKGDYVVYQVKDGKTHRSVVQKIRDIAEQVIFSTELNAGDQIVTTAVGRLGDNIPVTILEEKK